jgi:hypothetical protein
MMTYINGTQKLCGGGGGGGGGSRDQGDVCN